MGVSTIKFNVALRYFESIKRTCEQSDGKIATQKATMRRPKTQNEAWERACELSNDKIAGQKGKLNNWKRNYEGRKRICEPSNDEIDDQQGNVKRQKTQNKSRKRSCEHTAGGVRYHQRWRCIKDRMKDFVAATFFSKSGSTYLAGR